MTSASVRLPVEGDLPSLAGATEWLNSEPLTPAGLRGKVVAVDFWTYTCINWLRTLPYIRAWAERYREHGLVVIGVHTPEFSFEHDVDNVRRAVEDMGVRYPVAVDNDYAIWRAFGNRYWPALYLVDVQGRIRHHRFGEGDEERSELVIQELLAEAGYGDVDQEPVSVHAAGVEAAADWEHLGSPENYLGYERTDNFASPGGAVPNVPRSTRSPRGWDSTSGLSPATGRSRGRPPSSTGVGGGSPIASTPATCIWSWGRQLEAPRCASVCFSTGSRRASPTGPMSTTRATARWTTSGSTR